MRKLLLLSAVLSLAVCSVGPAQAFEVKNKFFISPHGGLSIPLGDFADDDSSGAKTGFNLGLAVEYGVTEQLLIGGRFAYGRYGVKDELLPSDDAEAHWTVLEIVGLYGKYLIPTTRPTRPYVRGGLFLGKPDFEGEDGGGSWSADFDVSLGFEAALGVTHMFSPQFGLGLEARFSHLNTSVKDSDDGSTGAYKPTGAFGPMGVRDPGGNIERADVSVYVTYSL